MKPEAVQTRYVKHFAGPVTTISEGSPTTPTADLGAAVVSGRPYWMATPMPIDPDGSDASIRRGLRGLDGKFSILVFGATKAVLATDALGCGGAYLAERDGSAFVASHLGCMARALSGPLEIDTQGAAAALAGSISISGSTPYRGIRRLRACEYAVIDMASGAVDNVGTYGTVRDIFDIDGESPGSTSELAALLRAAVEREVGVDGLFLSAGKDSQAIALSLSPEQRSRVPALSYGGWRSTDRRGSVRVAAQYGMRHRLLPPLRLRLRDYTDPIIRIGGGTSGMQTAQHVAGARTARAHRTVVLNGFLGDVLSGKNFRTGAAEQAKSCWLRHTPWMTRANGALESMFPDEVAANRTALQRELESHLDLPPGRALIIANLTHRQASFISGTFDMVHQEIETATPFFYRPLIHYCLTRTVHDLADTRLYEETLADLGYAGAGVSGWIGHVARSVGKRRGKYSTVDWQAVIRRSRPWLRRMVEDHRGEPIGRLAHDSIDSGSPLPLALFAIPILKTAQGPATHEETPVDPG